MFLIRKYYQYPLSKDRLVFFYPKTTHDMKQNHDMSSFEGHASQLHPSYLQAFILTERALRPPPRNNAPLTKRNPHDNRRFSLAVSNRCARGLTSLCSLLSVCPSPAWLHKTHMRIHKQPKLDNIGKIQKS